MIKLPGLAKKFSSKPSVESVEEKIQENIRSRDYYGIADSLEELLVLGRYDALKTCFEYSVVARYNQKKNTLTILDNEEMTDIDKEIFVEGLNRSSNETIFYDKGEICAHYFKGILRKREGVIPRIKFEAWTEKQEVSNPILTGLEFYAWGPGWKGDKIDFCDCCIRKNLKVPKNEPLKFSTLQEVVERVNSYQNFGIKSS